MEYITYCSISFTMVYYVYIIIRSVCIVIERYDCERLNYKKRMSNQKDVKGRYPKDLLAVKSNEIYLGNIWTAAYDGNFPLLMKYLDINPPSITSTPFHIFPCMNDTTPTKHYSTLDLLVEGAYYNFIQIVKPEKYGVWDSYIISDYGIERNDHVLLILLLLMYRILQKKKIQKEDL